MKNILITGPNGYIAKAFINKFRSDYNLKLFGRTCCENAHEFIKGDIRNLDDITGASTGVDVILHLAAATTDDANISDYDYFHVNLVGTFNILEAAVRSNVKKVIYASSVCAVGFRPTPKLIRENSECKPSDGMYGYSKYLSEKLCECYAEKYKLNIICLRNAMVVPQHNITIPANPFLPHWLGIVHIEDVIQAYRLAIDNETVHYGVFHIASNNRYSKFDITRAKKELGFTPQYNFEDLTKFNTSRLANIFTKVTSKLRGKMVRILKDIFK